MKNYIIFSIILILILYLIYRKSYKENFPKAVIQQMKDKDDLNYVNGYIEAKYKVTISKKLKNGYLQVNPEAKNINIIGYKTIILTIYNYEIYIIDNKFQIYKTDGVSWTLYKDYKGDLSDFTFPEDVQQSKFREIIKNNIDNLKYLIFYLKQTNSKFKELYKNNTNILAIQFNDDIFCLLCDLDYNLYIIFTTDNKNWISTTDINKQGNLTKYNKIINNERISYYKSLKDDINNIINYYNNLQSKRLKYKNICIDNIKIKCGIRKSYYSTRYKDNKYETCFNEESNDQLDSSCKDYDIINIDTVYPINNNYDNIKI